MEPNGSQGAAWPLGRVALATLIVLAVVSGFWILFRFRLVFFSLFTAVVLSTAFIPLINILQRWRIPRNVGIILISLAFLAGIVILILTVAPLLIAQWATLASLLGSWYRDLHDTLLESTSLLARRIARQLPGTLPLTIPPPNHEQTTNGETLDLVQQVFLFGSAVLRSVLTFLGIGLLTSFWILEGERAKRFFLLAIPAGRREGIREFLGEIENKIGSYTRGLVLLSGIIGGMALVAYMIIGLPNALLLALFAGVMEAIPLIGPLVGAVPAILVAVSTDPSKVVWVIIASIVIQALENNLIVPRVMDRSVGINPVASLLAFIAFGSIFGFVGALLAIPLAAVIQITLSRFLFQPNPVEQNPPARRDTVSALRYEAQNLVLDVRKQVREKETELDERADQVEDAMEAIIQDLDSILAQTETVSNGNASQAGSTGQPA